jgi:ribosomal protein L14
MKKVNKGTKIKKPVKMELADKYMKVSDWKHLYV